MEIIWLFATKNQTAISLEFAGRPLLPRNRPKPIFLPFDSKMAPLFKNKLTLSEITL
jgi:hypothetical protein